MKYRIAAVLCAFIATFVAPAYAKDIFTVTGTAIKGVPASLVLTVTDDAQGIGFFRGADNYQRGTFKFNSPVPCGESFYYFEVWSNYNVSFMPPLPPGVRTDQISANFSLDGVAAMSPAIFSRSIKGTFKKQSHWKGEDFGIRVVLNCS